MANVTLIILSGSIYAILNYFSEHLKEIANEYIWDRALVSRTVLRKHTTFLYK